MCRMQLTVLSAVLVLMLGGVASAGIIYTVESPGITEMVIDPLQSAETAAQFYDYKFARFSGRPGDFTQDDTAFFWLYEDSNTGVLSLGMVFDKLNNAGIQGGGGSMDLTTSGMPGSAFQSVEDDDGDLGPMELINHNATWGWNEFNTDGAMVSGLQNQTWEIDIQLNNFTGLQGGFFFMDGPNSTTPTALNLGDEGELLEIPIIIRAKRMPEPMTLGLFAIGLAALGVARRRL